MPHFHIVQSWKNDYDDIERRAAEGNGPRYGVPLMVRRLGAKLHQAIQCAPAVSFSDRLRSRLIGIPQTWSFVHDVAPRLGSNDVVYCVDAEVGIPMAAAIRRKSGRPKLAVYLHNLDRPRGRLAAKLLRIADSIDLFFSCCSSQLEFVRDYLKVPEDRTFLLLQHVDTRFFSPGPPTPGKTRPVVVAVGREQRDYATLARATQDLDVDVWVDAWSATARKQPGLLPREVPANMSFRHSKPRELVQLYRDGDVVVVPMFPNKYAGITSLIEGLACERPVVASRTRGLVDYLSPPDGISPVEPSDPDAMRQRLSDSSSTRRRPEFRPARDMNRSTGATISSVTSRPSPRSSKPFKPTPPPSLSSAARLHTATSTSATSDLPIWKQGWFEGLRSYLLAEVKFGRSSPERTRLRGGKWKWYLTCLSRSPGYYQEGGTYHSPSIITAYRRRGHAHQ